MLSSINYIIFLLSNSLRLIPNKNKAKKYTAEPELTRKNNLDILPSRLNDVHSSIVPREYNKKSDITIRAEIILSIKDSHWVSNLKALYFFKKYISCLISTMVQ